MTKRISGETVKRLINDIKCIRNEPLHDNGIFYEHDEVDMLIGYALIIGPVDTPYAYGNFLFKFIFPVDYPHSPPQVVYCTNYGNMRFNPNLYSCGKVCVSVLNTWRGEQWTGCQTISSILLMLCSLLNSTPLLNEPGITANHADNINYNKIVKYNTFDIAINRILTKEIMHPCFAVFNDVIIAKFIKNYDYIMTIINEAQTEKLRTGLYNLTYNCDYDLVKKKLIEHYNLLQDSCCKN